MKAIVITSIASPTPAVAAFLRVPGWRVYVVGDRKTPPDWACAGVRYLSVAEQTASPGALAPVLPWNHYCRKMLGYLAAAADGATTIVDTDDDNLPKAGWGMPAFSGTWDAVPEGRGFVNIYRLFTDQHIWPRGFPLARVLAPEAHPDALTPAAAEVGIWQGLADGDADVDAIYRLTCNQLVAFAARAPVVLQPGTLCPCNSQNTAFRKETFPLLYLPATVTFRFTDILRGLVAQPILWAAGYTLGFTGATVVQERNPHDYQRDFLDEVPMYRHAAAVPDLVAAALDPAASIPDNLRRAYAALQRAGIVLKAELGMVDGWLDDLAGAWSRNAVAP